MKRRALILAGLVLSMFVSGMLLTRTGKFLLWAVAGVVRVEEGEVSPMGFQAEQPIEVDPSTLELIEQHRESATEACKGELMISLEIAEP